MNHHSIHSLAVGKLKSGNVTVFPSPEMTMAKGPLPPLVGHKLPTRAATVLNVHVGHPGPIVNDRSGVWTPCELQLVDVMHHVLRGCPAGMSTEVVQPSGGG